MKNNFQLIHVGGPYWDCTDDYTANFDKPFKVKDFLSIIEEQKEEWGIIEFFIPYYASKNDYDSFKVDYEHGIIDYTGFNKFISRKNQALFNTNIKEITANGGRSLMQYKVILEK